MYSLPLIIGLPVTVCLIVTIFLLHLCIHHPGEYRRRLGIGVSTPDHGIAVLAYMLAQFVGIANLWTGGILLALSWMPLEWGNDNGGWMPQGIATVFGASLALLSLSGLHGVADRLLRLQQFEDKSNNT